MEMVGLREPNYDKHFKFPHLEDKQTFTCITLVENVSSKLFF